MYLNNRTGTGVNTGISVSSSHDVVVANNIAVSQTDWASGGYSLSTTADCTATSWLNNLVQGTIDSDVSSRDTDNPTRFGNPLFVDAASANFHLAAGSPALAAALPGYATDDFLGRPRSGTPSIGAIEG